MKVSYRHRVLVVDDVPENGEVIQAMLARSFEVQVVRSGAQALAAARAQPRPDLILLDVMMPGLDGYDVLSRLKNDPATEAIPVVFLTALDSAADRHSGMDLGAAGYLHKPVSQRQLVTTLRALLPEAVPQIQEASAL